MPVPAARALSSYARTVSIVTTPTSCAAVAAVAGASPAVACWPMDWPPWRPPFPNRLPFPNGLVDPLPFGFVVEGDEAVVELFAVSSATVAVPSPPMQRTATVATVIGIHGARFLGAGSGVDWFSGW